MAFAALDGIAGLSQARFFLATISANSYNGDVTIATICMKQKQDASWLLLTYKVPTEPSKVRVGIWRRIRGLGAVYIQNSICVLPASNEHQRQLRMVQSDIEQAGGEAVIFETLALDPRQEELVVSRFQHDRDQDYEEFLDKCADYKREVQKEVDASHYTFAELKENDEDLKKLKNWLDRIKALDFYGAPAKVAADQQLGECEAMLDAYANEVYEREQGARSTPLPRLQTAPSVKAKAKRARAATSAVSITPSVTPRRKKSSNY